GVTLKNLSSYFLTFFNIFYWASSYKILLLHPNINVNIKNNAGDTPLHQLCKNNHYGIILIVKELLKMESIDIHVKNNQHLSPITVAREYNYYEIEAILTTAEKNSDYENSLS
ncbi:MAG: ankyrin repeat domain-containing protein, partial [Burkholderiales bacterium]|nr:ankyrin repeat domain-containing protein [Burkholderiales bacterium]